MFAGYFALNKFRYTDLAKYYLIVGSLFFYSWWNIIYLPLIILSVVINYLLTRQMTLHIKQKKIYLLIGLAFNVGLLGYFKYADFFISNINFVLTSDISLLHLALPLAISFFTLQQIAFLIDSYGGLVKEKSFTDYALFVVFFPQLIAGPIVHHKEMMPQFATIRGKIINYKNVAAGLFLFSIGLFKKVVIADTFSEWASAGFSASDKLNMIEAWITSLSYTFQLYFDFSGYTDMAIGIALLFNIKLPQNFNSPYQSTSIIEFWSRWHMTLTRFLTTYIYNTTIKSFGKFSFNKAMFATFVTMFIAGLWHGAAWTFVIFGTIHGLALIVNHYWKSKKLHLNKFIAWFLTFNFLNLSFVIFRAESMNDALNIFSNMFCGDLVLSSKYFAFLVSYQNELFTLGEPLIHIHGKAKTLLFIVLAFFIIFKLRNTSNILMQFKTTRLNLILALTLFISSVLLLSQVSEFLYFNF